MARLLQRDRAGHSIDELVRIAAGGALEPFGARSLDKLREYGFTNDEF